MTAADICQHLHGHRSGAGYVARCPVHDDKTPSLGLKDVNGRILVHCFAGCEQAAVVAALKARHLWPDHEEHSGRRIVAEYSYTDETGDLLYQICRFEPKDFRPRFPDRAGGWLWKKHPNQVLYHLREVLENPIIFVVQGERDVETLRSYGFVATTNAGGAKAPWLPQYSAALRGREVLIVPDNDRPGWDRAAKISRALLGTAARIRLIDLPKEHKDVTEWFEAGHSECELIAMMEGVHALDIASIEDIDIIEKHAVATCVTGCGPKVFNIGEILALDVPEASMLIEGIVPAAGASLIVGAAKSGKTLAAVQMAIAVASGEALYDNYRVLSRGPVLIVEQDDPAGAGSVKTILQRSKVDVAAIPFHLIAGVPYQFGSEFLAWLKGEIVRLGIRLVVLDSYTALRGSRPKGVDIVKAEQTDLMQLDALAKRTNCALVIIHHSSKGSAGLDWSEKAAGTFAMSAATESQMFISRFPELDGSAAERLVRIRGRHSEDLEMVLRFRKETLDYELALEGGASSLYPLILHLETAFGARAFSPKEISHATGLSIATAHRQISRLYRANAIQKIGHGEYVLVA